MLHLLNSRHFNGAERVIATLMAGCADQIDSVFVSRHGPVEEAVTSRGLSFLGISRLSRAEVTRVIDRFRPHIIHAHDYRASLVAATFPGPIVSHLHNNYPWARRPGPITFAYGLALARISRVIAVSSAIVDEHYCRRALAPKCTVIANGVDLDRLSRTRPAERGADLAFVGRMTEQKDPVAFVRIVAALQRPGRPVTATMFGDGELRPACVQTAEALGLRDVLEVAGYVPDPMPRLAACRVLVVPSRWEGFGLAAVEAMALGVPALGRPVGGLGEILADVSPELVCTDEASLTERAGRLLDDEALRMRLSRECRRAVEGRYSAKAMVDAVRDVYDEVSRTPKGRLVPAI